MRLVYLNGDAGVPVRGSKGASVHVREMVKAMARRVDHIDVLTYRLQKGEENLAESFGAPGRVGKSGSISLHSFRRGNRREASRETRLLSSNDDAAKMLGQIVADAVPDGIYERYSLWSVAGAACAEKHGIPYILEVNAPLVSEQGRFRSMELETVARFIEGNLFRTASRVLVVSSELGRYVRGRGVDPKKIEVVPNGYGDSFNRETVRRAGNKASARKNGSSGSGSSAV